MKCTLVCVRVCDSRCADRNPSLGACWRLASHALSSMAASSRAKYKMPNGKNQQMAFHLIPHSPLVHWGPLPRSHLKFHYLVTVGPLLPSSISLTPCSTTLLQLPLAATSSPSMSTAPLLTNSPARLRSRCRGFRCVRSTAHAGPGSWNRSRGRLSSSSAPSRPALSATSFSAATRSWIIGLSFFLLHSPTFVIPPLLELLLLLDFLQ